MDGVLNGTALDRSRPAAGTHGGLDATGARSVPVDPLLASLVPDGGLRRGSVVGIGAAPGWCSLLLALLAGAMTEGAWAALVGLPDLGVEGAAGLGVPLDRLALVPDPGSRWPEVAAALLDAVELVALCLPGRCRPADARRLAARVRARRGVLFVSEASPPGFGGASWPAQVDLELVIESSRWSGLDRGGGVLQGREVTVRAGGRRAGPRARMARLWLPAATGGLAPAEDPAEPARPAVHQLAG
ncbi:MAG: hypothetical protein ACRDZR_02720 [Acidimicrobiales bacterium]